MEVATSISRLRELIRDARRRKLSIGCVPTMGALHCGHGALIERARAECGLVVVTIFVNPIQFDRKDDYEQYARDFEADSAFCRQRGVDVLFAPSEAEMYPQPARTFVEAPGLGDRLCGAFRPGHFRGVATVVAKLFNIVQPDVAYFGEKDAQQLAIIRQMAADLNFPVSIAAVPTVREEDGLAVSSRNRRLSAEQRRAAPVLFRALCEGRRLIAGGERDASKVKTAICRVLAAEPAIRLEYAEIVDSHFKPVHHIESDVRILAAAWIGSTRLIDNLAAPVGDR